MHVIILRNIGIHMFPFLSSECMNHDEYHGLLPCAGADVSFMIKSVICMDPLYGLWVGFHLPIDHKVYIQYLFKHSQCGDIFRMP
eukprot:879498_1